MAKIDIKKAEADYLKKLKEEGLTVSVSRIQQYRKCHQAHYYKYVLKLTRKLKGSALQRGSALHECLEYYYQGKSWKKSWLQFKEEFFKTHFPEEIAELGDIPQLVYNLMENYVECYEDEELEYIETELEFNVPLVKEENINIIGFIDFLARDSRGILIGETKTHKNFPDYDVRLFNTQSALYAWVIKDQLKLFPNERVDRILWNYIRAKDPSTPRILKDGNISRAKLDSTPFTVKKFLKENGLKDKDYQELIDAQSFDNYFRRDIVSINKNVVATILEDTRETAKQILHNPLVKDKNINKMNCNYCDYKNLCQAQLCDPDADIDFMIKADFEIRERKEEDNGKGKKGSNKKSKKQKFRR